MAIYVGGTATANQLDDYEEGTCTLALQLGGVQHGDYSANTGRYTKVGDVCHIQISLYVTNIGGGIYRSGVADCSGLPFTAITASYGEASFTAGNHNNASVPIIIGAVHGGAAKLRFRRGGSLEFDGNRAHNQNGVGDTFWIHGTLTYKTL